eukprot:3092987-Ditylum_brightwellii.AAC.1
MDDHYKQDGGVFGARMSLFDVVRSIDDGVQNPMEEESVCSPANLSLPGDNVSKANLSGCGDHNCQAAHSLFSML